VALAANAASEDQAHFIAEAMQMLVRFQTTAEPLDTVTARGTVTARTRRGAVVVPAPVDYVAWTQRVAEFARRFRSQGFRAECVADGADVLPCPARAHGGRLEGP